MSLTRVVIGYIVLVLIPLAALISVLRAGGRLKAPVNLDGLWNLTVEKETAFPGSCGVRFAPETRPTMRVSQSGLYLTFILNDASQTSVSGVLRNGLIQAGEHSASCQPSALSLTASSTSHEGIAGTIAENACPSCRPVAFRATRAANNR